jgi:hypothetical protein
MGSYLIVEATAIEKRTRGHPVLPPSLFGNFPVFLHGNLRTRAARRERGAISEGRASCLQTTYSAAPEKFLFRCDAEDATGRCSRWYNNAGSVFLKKREIRVPLPVLPDRFVAV